VNDGREFKRKPFNTAQPLMKKAEMENMRELGVEMKVITSGVSKTAAQWQAKAWSMFGMLLFGIFVFFLVKNQLWPLAKYYYQERNTTVDEFKI